MTETIEQSWKTLGYELRLGCHYHQERRRFFERWNNAATLTGLLLSSGTAVTLIGDKSETAIILAFGVTVVQAFALVINFAQKAWTHRDLQNRFIDLIADWKHAAAGDSDLQRIEAGRLSIEKSEPIPMPYLVTRCEIDVMRRDSVPKESWPRLAWWKRSLAQYLPELG